MSLHLQNHLTDIEVRLSQLEREEHFLSEELFNTMRNAVLNAWLRACRLHSELEFMKRMGYRGTLNAFPAMEIASAGVLLLTHGTHTQQEFFINAGVAGQLELAKAVVKDGGIWNAEGTWSVIP